MYSQMKNPKEKSPHPIHVTRTTKRNFTWKHIGLELDYGEDVNRRNAKYMGKCRKLSYL